MMALCTAHTQLKFVYGVSRVTCHRTPGPPCQRSEGFGSRLVRERVLCLIIIPYLLDLSNLKVITSGQAGLNFLGRDSNLEKFSEPAEVRVHPNFVVHLQSSSKSL